MPVKIKMLLLDSFCLIGAFVLYYCQSPWGNAWLWTYALDYAFAAVLLICFLFPRDKFALSSKNISPAAFWRSVLASKSGLQRFLFLVMLGIFAALANSLPSIRELVSSLFLPGLPAAQVGYDNIAGTSRQEFSLDWLFFIPLSYSVAVFTSFKIARLISVKNAAEDRQLLESKKQRWTDLSMLCFGLAFIASVAGITFAPHGPVSWLANWLVSSGHDANLPKMSYFVSWAVDIFNSGIVEHPPQVITFVIFLKCLLFSGLVTMLWRPAVSLAQLLNAFVRRMLSGSNPLESFLSAWRQPWELMPIKKTRSHLQNGFSALVWLSVCYLSLFALFGFSQGPLADAIVNWMDASVLDAGYRLQAKTEKLTVLDSELINGRKCILVKETGNTLEKARVFYQPKPNGKWSRVLFVKGGPSKLKDATLVLESRTNVNDLPQLRIFLASIIALYGTAPFAITACVFLPYGTRRRLRINDDGILLPTSSLGLISPLRLWSDLKTLDITGKETDKTKRRLVFGFFSGKNFSLRVDQLAPENMERLLAAIDEYAQYCLISDAVLELRSELKQSLFSRSTTSESEFRFLPAAAFSSTVFVPAEIGDTLPGNPNSAERLRVVRQLSSKPLAAVYLARRSGGGLALVKQFYLAEDTAEAQSMRRYFEREYKVLSELCHPRIAKVIDCFSSGESSYLVLEYFRGLDLRRLIKEQGIQAEATVRRYARQLAELMIYLHSQAQPVLHRDLSPDNIILAEDGHLALIDFGAAHQFLEHITGTMIGKKCYVAPEQLRGHAAISSDIYSFGSTLHYLLTGTDPVALTECFPSSKVKLSRELNELVRSCTSFESEKRPASFQQILEILDAIEGSETNTLLSKEELQAEDFDPLLEKFAAICKVNDEPSLPPDSLIGEPAAHEHESVAVDLIEVIALDTTPRFCGRQNHD